MHADSTEHKHYKHRSHSKALALLNVVASALLCLLLCTMLSAAPAEASGCGQAGQRACCIFEASSACGAGLAEVAGCLVDCECSNLPGTPSLSSCIPATPCGGEGQRACCSATNEGAACQAGL